MRTKKAAINVGVNILTYILIFIPTFIVRKIFLNTLGDNLLGVNSLYNNIISLLSVVEMGIGSAIVFSLYKPYAEGNKSKIKAYLKYYGRLYRIIGFIVLGLGIGLMFFLNIFIKGQINMVDARIYFLIFLLDTFFSYLFSYKICILNVAQEGYRVSIATCISKFTISVLQIIFLMIYPSFYIYIIIQVLVQLIYYIGINWYINKKYSWLNTVDGKLDEEEKNSLIKNVKALFLHKVGALMVFSTDNLIISAFINLKTVTKFNNYSMVLNIFQNVINNAFSGITASIGNLLVEKDDDSAYIIHKRLFFLSFWCVSFITISLFNTINQFITIWMGETQRIDTLTITVLLINFYFVLMRSSVDKFKEGSGQYYQDRYAAIIESAVNLVASIILVKILGLPGVFIGTLISNFTVVFWVKPKIVYKYVFKKNLLDYFKMYFKYLLIGLIPFVITTICTTNLRGSSSLIYFILNCLVNVVIINVIYIVIFYKTEEFNYFKNLIFTVIKRRS
ncbi:lipopolysaccharide biosynthesis protein [Clostridium chauvoei]|uniref:O-unit flippase n=2 Tax=Clostridium chauvoei TaxID=46867 RepID=A0ABD4RER2_9CLOT|nr:flippase [Clostridium chauvoei]ATD54371.1 O-unit flippase [Clostridium chauvoei]ATD57945.1 O-unit flippase [Clostridium chauvoei]MBX7279738.1 O-unit flippase [Clostridium chauvoei]MBX7282107.1 O-unit flippase [Clostridium chauvoei]MBX7284629.1 O-unit flippase [Clostridium chauvoei]